MSYQFSFPHPISFGPRTKKTHTLLATKNHSAKREIKRKKRAEEEKKKEGMNRNHYDGDATTWSPQGRLFQVEYAMEAVKQGSCCVGLKSKTHSVVAVIKRNTSKLSAFQQKIFKIDSHMGIAIAGLTADARVLCKYMRTECLNHTFVYDSPLPVGRLVRQVADKSQVHTQRYGRRPYGVGLLVAGWDKEQGPQLCVPNLFLPSLLLLLCSKLTLFFPFHLHCVIVSLFHLLKV